MAFIDPDTVSQGSAFIDPDTVPQQTSRDSGDELKRQVGLTGRHVLSGAAGLADMAASPVRYVMNTVVNPPRNMTEVMFGRPDDPFGMAQNIVHQSNVLPKPETATERVVGKGVEGLVSGLGFAGGANTVAKNVVEPVAKVVAKTLATRPVESASLAGLSGGASQASEEGEGSSPTNIAAGVLAPVAAMTLKRGVSDPIMRQSGQIIDAGFLKGGDTRAAARVATDVLGDNASLAAGLMRQGDKALTAAQSALPAKSAEFSGLERIVGSYQPEAYAKDIGSIAVARGERVAQGMKDLNAQLGPVREAILKIADNSGRVSVNPIMSYIKNELADPNTIGNTAKQSALRYYGDMLNNASNSQTGQISAYSLYGIRKNAGLHLKGLAEKEGWDKKTTSAVTKEIQSLIDDQITSVSGIHTRTGGSAWNEQYIAPFSKEAQRLSGINQSAKTSDKLGSAGRKRATQISRIDEAPVQLPNPLMRSVMVINAIMRAAQGRGGEATTKRLAELMRPENKAELAKLIDEEIARRNAIPGLGESIVRSGVYGAVGSE